MINNLTYRQKNKYLVYGFGAALLIVYLLAISKTITLWKENSLLQNNLVTQHAAKKKYSDIKNRSEEINAQITKYFTDSISHDELLLKTISELCHQEKVLLKDMPLIEKSKEGNYYIFTNRVTLEGNYKGLLQVLYQLETKHNIGRIASANFKTYTDHKKKKEILMLVMYVQCIISL